MMRPLLAFTLATLVVLGAPLAAAAQERLCDTQFEDCREPLLELIRNETVGIDVAFWFMEDSRYVAELIRRKDAGVPVRVLVDQRANASKRLNETILNALRDGGIPMREKYTGDILHFKMMYFRGQNVVQFSKANYTPLAFVPIEPNVNYDDEAIFFTNDSSLTSSFQKRFDDLWINTSQYRNFANVSGPLVRACQFCAIHWSMNFPPTEDFSNRSVSRYNAETQAIDAIVFRVTDHRQANGMIDAVARGAAVRLITEPTEYRNPTRVWHSKHVDRMYMGGVQIKHRQHAGMAHQASVVMHGLGEVIFGSSNWTTASAGYQDEHNYFYHPSLNKPWFFQWFATQFERKWNDTTNYVPFEPLPPGSPAYSSPQNGAAGVSSSATLTWDGGNWAHLYDIYFGTTPSPPLVQSNVELGSPLTGQLETLTVDNLLPGTTYYWRIVGKTWAQLTNSGPVWSFTTAGTPPDGGTPPPGGTSPAYGGTPPAMPGTFQAENFDEGGQGVAYYDTTGGNSGSAYRATDVDLEAAADSGGGFNVMKTRAGEWLKYTVNVTTTGTYTLEARVASQGTGARFHVEVDGVDRTGPITIPNTGGWQTWQTVSVSGIPLSAGLRVIRVSLDTVGTSGGVGNYNWFRFVEGTSASPAPPPSPAYGGTPVALPGIVQAENFDVGSQGVAYSDASSGNSGGVYRSTDVDIGPTGDPSSGGYYVGWTRVGEWLNYTVNATQTRTYTVNVRLANVGSGATFRIEVDGVDRTGPVSVPNTGGWDVWQTIAVGGIPFNQGEHVIRLVMLTRNAENSGVGNFGYLSLQ
ncbi:MAG TPA: carbohydrate-binding domain-containing protein [Vicinamibacterales bacterium]|nr:carbohydrate-binding domain-containing protein [Vicinamibacterales bacterium]